MPVVYLSLGTNLEDRQKNLEQALFLLAKDVTIEMISSVYETPALLPENAPTDWDKPYLNLVFRGETDLDPHVLLEKTQAVEEALGRVKIGEWGPRLIDVDILAFGDVTLDEPELRLPHPEMLKRAFIMLPLAEIAPDFMDARTVAYALEHDRLVKTTIVLNWEESA